MPEGTHLLPESDTLKEAREPFKNDDNIGWYFQIYMPIFQSIKVRLSEDDEYDVYVRWIHGSNIDIE